MDKDKILIKIRNLKHDLEYHKRVYPNSKTIIRLRSRIYYYNRKLISI